MSVIPVLKIGWGNAWIFMIWFILFPVLSSSGRKGKEVSKKLQPKEHDKLMDSMTMAIVFAGFIYSIFLPLQFGTVWFYMGLFLFIIAFIISITLLMTFFKTPVDKPFTKGPYRFSRHPLYLSQFLILFSISIASISWIFFLLTLIMGLFQKKYAFKEERSCVKKYGDVYQKYLNRTPRWIGLPKR
ncbi:MAG: DUF1295 domain-containing protein [Sedimentisphaerales bacterium]|nr:DUF1295 domain-containing protein [Sedimentisphaerales bacterium]